MLTTGYKSSKNQEKIRRRHYHRTAAKGRNAVMCPRRIRAERVTAREHLSNNDE